MPRIDGVQLAETADGRASSRVLLLNLEDVLFTMEEVGLTLASLYLAFRTVLGQISCIGATSVSAKQIYTCQSRLHYTCLTLTYMNRTIRTSQLPIEVPIIKSLPKRLTCRMISLELPVIRYETVNVPSFVTELSPVIQILPRRHAEHVVVNC